MNKSISGSISSFETSQIPATPQAVDTVSHNFPERTARALYGKALAGLATLSLAVSGAVELDQPSLAEAASQKQPINHVNKSKEKPCKPSNQVRLSLTHVGDSSGTEYYIARARACKKTVPRMLRNVKLDERGPEGQHRNWILKKLAPNHQQARGFTLEEPTNFDSQDRRVTLKAYSNKGKRIGSKSWDLKDVPEEPPSPQTAILAQELKAAEKNCDPNPNFKVGVQDDNQFVFHQEISRDTAFNEATRILGANLLRINMIYGQVKAYGLQPYIETVDEAINRGYKVDLTIMSTPRYLSALDQNLSWNNHNPDLMRDFAREVAQTFGSKILYYSVVNEPNIGSFNANQDPETFKREYLAGREGILQGYPGAKVIAGELANVDMPRWINIVNGLPNDGVAIHPYGGGFSRIDEFRDLATSKLLITEYGNFRSNPNQLNDDLTARRIAECKGFEQILFFQLVRDPLANWNTGLIDPPESPAG